MSTKSKPNRSKSTAQSQRSYETSDVEDKVPDIPSVQEQLTFITQQLRELLEWKATMVNHPISKTPSDGHAPDVDSTLVNDDSAAKSDGNLSDDDTSTVKVALNPVITESRISNSKIGKQNVVVPPISQSTPARTVQLVTSVLPFTGVLEKLFPNVIVKFISAYKEYVKTNVINVGLSCFISLDARILLRSTCAPQLSMESLLDLTNAEMIALLKAYCKPASTAAWVHTLRSSLKYSKVHIESVSKKPGFSAVKNGNGFSMSMYDLSMCCLYDCRPYHNRYCSFTMLVACISPYQIWYYVDIMANLVKCYWSFYSKIKIDISVYHTCNSLIDYYISMLV